MAQPNRRAVLGGAGFLILGFCLGGRTALGQEAAAPASRLPGSLASHKSLDAWMRIGADGTVTVLSGKVELGQGILTALAQIVADELDVVDGALRMVPADTDLSPDEGYTSGSMSIQQSGARCARPRAEARASCSSCAATRLGVAVADLRVDDGRVARWRIEHDVLGAGLGHDAPRRSDRPRDAEAASAAARWSAAGAAARHPGQGASASRASSTICDSRGCCTRGWCVRRAPARVSTRVDDAATRALPGVVAIVRDGSFLAVVAEREEQAIAGADALAARGALGRERRASRRRPRCPTGCVACRRARAR